MAERGVLTSKGVSSSGLFYSEAEYRKLNDELEEAKRSIGLAIKYIKEAVPDFPYDKNHKFPLTEAVWAATQSIEGLRMACDDLQRKLTKVEKH